MEKRTPHCRLGIIKTLVGSGRINVTRTAQRGASALGMELSDIIAVVMALKPEDFHKSMTPHADHRIWQDVYRPSTCMGAVYLKLMIIDDVLIVSFKEL